jgi:hypothetical protein
MIKSGADQVKGDITATNKLYNDVDSGIFNNFVRIGCKRNTCSVTVTRTGQIANGCPGNFDFPTCPTRDLFTIAPEHIYRSGTYCAKADHADTDWFHMISIRRKAKIFECAGALTSVGLYPKLLSGDSVVSHSVAGVPSLKAWQIGKHP